jgi:hypothetical protein
VTVATEDGVSAGSVYVTVSPSSKGFWAKFVADNQAGAEKAGDDLGDRIGKAIATRIGKGVRDGVDGAGAGVRAQGAKVGNEYGGTFADTAKRRIEAALRSLPTPQIGVATSEAEQKLKDLRGELSTLASKRIGVDIGATEALEQVRRLKTELDRLAGSSPNAQVRVDTGNAAVELLAIDRELTRLDGRRANATVDVDTNAPDATSRMQLLVSAGLALGPAIVPAAAAGAAGIAGLGAAALSAAPAIGVVALAYRGVGDAVKALNTAQQDTAKTGTTVVQQQRTLASSADQVRSAEASLANTRANAADAQRRSLQQIADAERQVGAAQLEAKRAQDALNDAREQERRSQQDTAFQLRQNAIDQRRAAAEVASAAAAVSHDGSQQARDALDEALLHQEELRVAGDRLTAEQQRNQQTGIDGSKRVVAAQDAIAQSQQRVADAERGVAAARQQAASQARQAAFSIAQAQQAVITAQRAAGAATVAAATAGSAAVDKLNAEMQGLPVSAQTFARFLFSLQPQLRQLQTTAADGILPGTQQSIETLLPYFGALDTTVSDVAATVGDLQVRAAHTLTSPFWRQFFGYVASEATPALVGLYDTSINVGEGFAHILLEFAPVERQVGGGIVSLSEKFRDWSRSLDENRGFQEFVRYAQTEGPRVVATIGALANAGLRIVEAYAPVGSVVTTELRVLAQVIDGIPVPVITALASALTAYKTAALVTSGAQSLLNSGLLQGIAQMITYRTVTDAAGVSTTGMQRAVGAASGFMGGPFVAVLTAVGLAIGYFVAKSQEAKAHTDALRSSFDSLGQTFKDGVTPAALDAAKATLAHDESLRGLVTTTQHAGISTQTLIAGLNGDRDARTQVVSALDAQITASKKAAEHYAALGAGQQQNAQAASANAERLTQLRDAFASSSDAASEAADLTKAFTEDQKRANDVFADASPRVKTLAEAYQTLADGASTAAAKSDALKQAEDALFGAARDADQAAADQARAIRNTNKALDDQNLLNADGARKLDLNTDAGARLRDSLRDQLIAIDNTYRANVANGVSVAEATKKHDEEVEALRKNAAQHDLNKDAVQHLIDTYGKVPTSATTDVAITGLDATKSQLQELLVYQYALRNGLTLGEARDKVDPLIRTGGGKGNARGGNLATGGPVVGPGTGTSDDVPAMERTTGAPFWLSNGEWVHRTAAVNYYGQAAMRAINEQRIPREAITGYATGGLIGNLLTDHYPYPTTTAATRIPSRAEVAQIVLEGPSSGGREDIKAFIRSTGSLPYIWAAAGPSGYDCCLPGRTLIHGPNGPRRIDEIQSGDMVYSRGDNGVLVERKVVRAWRSIDQQTYRLKIRGRNVDASANHPFLRVTGGRVRTTGGPCAVEDCARPARGRGLCATCYTRLARHNALPETYPQVEQYETEWVRLDQLRRGDVVVVLDAAAPECVDDGPLLPDGRVVTERMAWLFGAIIGDGTVGSRNIRLAAFGEFACRAAEAFDEAFGLVARPHPTAGLIVSSVSVATMLLSLGFWRRGAEKRVPEAVWSWPQDLKLAFCAGYAAADGYMGRDGQSYASCSRRLIDEVRLIHMEAGHRVTNVTTNMRRKPITIKGKLVKNAKPLHNFVVSSLEREPYRDLRVGCPDLVKRELTGGAFGVRVVLGVEPLGVEPTYDLNIDENHNFVADGVLVHNSGLASAVFGLATGRGGGHGQRYFTTYDFQNGAPGGFKPGAGGVLTIGVNPQTHMAGNYGGLGFEAASTRSGIKIGTAAKKPSTFEKQFHLASGGLVSTALLDKLGLDIGGDPSGLTVDGRRIPLGAYDVGGYLPQGLSLAYNGTGRPEPVVPADRLERASTSRPPVVQNFYPAADLDERAVATMAARRLALAAVG